MRVEPVGETSLESQFNARSRSRWFAALIPALVAAVAIGLVSAQPASSSRGRSTKAFCSQVHRGTKQLRAAALKSEAIGRKNALLGLISAFGNIGDFALFLDRLNRTAPSPIASDMKIVDKDFHDMIDSSPKAAGQLLTGNPIGLAVLLVKGALHAHSYERVDQFSASHCGLAIFGPARAH